MNEGSNETMGRLEKLRVGRVSFILAVRKASVIGFALGLLLLEDPACMAGPMAGTNILRRAAQSGAAISVEDIIANDSDTKRAPFMVTAVNTNSAQGGTIVRSNDWLYYTPPNNDPATDSFDYVISDLLGQSATGAVTVLASANLPAANLLSVSLQTNDQAGLRFTGEVGPYFIQSSSNLETWSSLGARMAWPTGSFDFVDPVAIGPSAQRFYRAATGALAPVITNFQASGTANVQVDFNLGIEGGTNSPYPATILTLPSSGALFQGDGTPITNVPAQVTASNGLLHYFGPENLSGTPADSFEYKVTRPSDGLDSLPQTFQISLAADIPTIATPTPNVPENGSATIQLIASDPDLRYASNSIRFLVVFTVTRGKLYQVNSDGTPNENAPITNGTWVTNPGNLIYYVPPRYEYGTPYESLTMQAVNSFGDTSLPVSLPINVYFVNTPPSASPTVLSGYGDDPQLFGYLQYSDPDRNVVSVRFPALPSRGRLYLDTGNDGDWLNGTLVTSVTNEYPIGDAGLIFLTDSHTNGTPCIPDPNDYGSPYATFTYIVTDAYGASATNSVTADVLPPHETFPVPAGPFRFTFLINSVTNLVPLSATNQDGSPLNSSDVFWLDSLPIHGELSDDGFPVTSSVSLPVQLLSPLLSYTPTNGYDSSRDGADGFSYHTSDTYDTMTCESNITITVVAPW